MAAPVEQPGWEGPDQGQWEGRWGPPSLNMPTEALLVRLPDSPFFFFVFSSPNAQEQRAHRGLGEDGLLKKGRRRPQARAPLAASVRALAPPQEGSRGGLRAGRGAPGGCPMLCIGVPHAGAPPAAK